MANQPPHSDSTPLTSDGSSFDLLSAIQKEQNSLYDYLMRMTGQVERSKQTLSEVVQVLSNSPTKFEDARAFRTQLYNTCRSFVGDIWNADTSSLINNGFELHRDITPRIKQLLSIDEELRRLPGQAREAVILFLRYRFDFEGSARIMGLTRSSVENVYHQGLDRVSLRTKVNAMMVEELVPLIPNHFVPQSSSHHTLDLSVMIKDLRGSRLRWRGRKLWVMIAVLLSIIISFLVWRK